jgi:hypothetical protein
VRERYPSPHHGRCGFQAVENDRRGGDACVNHGLAEAHRRRGGAVRSGGAEGGEGIACRERRRIRRILRRVLHLRLQHLRARAWRLSAACVRTRARREAAR